MQHLDLFSGIGGFALAAEMVWGKNINHIFCDNDPFCQAILKKHWPEAQIFGDIRGFTYTNPNLKGLEGAVTARIVRPDGRTSEYTRFRDGVHLLTGGFPCQPFSQAGRRKGTEDDRYLWPEMLRVIREFKPRWVIGENVGGFVTWNEGMVLRQVLSDLEGEGYEIQTFVIPAVAVNAPHRRDRVWIVANSTGTGAGSDHAGIRQEPLGDNRRKETITRNSNNKRLERWDKLRQGSGEWPNGSPSWEQDWLEVATRLCTLDDGLPNGLARPRGWRNAALKGAGNAIVPQVAYQIFKAIREVEKNLALTPSQNLQA